MLYTPEEAAKVFGVNSKIVKKWLRTGKMVAVATIKNQKGGKTEIRLVIDEK